MWRACLNARRLPGPRGEVAEWLKAADCKSARASVRWFESSPLHQLFLSNRIPIELAKTRSRPLLWIGQKWRESSGKLVKFEKMT